MPPAELIPPPPPGADDELCELLMSWYIAGYQSGRFMAKNAVEYWNYACTDINFEP